MKSKGKSGDVRIAGQDMEKKRMANMEALRILAMMMVVMLHYLSKGGVLPPMTGPLTVNGYGAWVLETFSIVAVNVYMLISGFFLTESRFKSGRLVELVCQVLFYSLLTWGLLAAFGVLKFSELGIYEMLQYILPVEMEQYWFATAYILLYLLTPILRCSVRHMKKEQLRAVILLLLLVFSVNKSVLPVRLAIDDLGYDVLWFVCVFLCSAYIRLYGIRWFDRGRKGAWGYLVCCAVIFAVTLGVRGLYLKTGKFEDFLLAAYHYNHILNLCAAICLFYAFYFWQVKEGWFAALVRKIGPCTFGVYLMHEQLGIRTLWPKWLHASTQGALPLFLARCIGSCAVVFVVGTVADMARALIFSGVKRIFAGKCRIFAKIDRAVNGADRDR